MRHNFQKQLHRVLLIAASTAVLAACNSAPPSSTISSDKPSTAPATTSQPANPDKKAKQDIRVQLPFLKQSLDAPLIVAIEKGYFAE